MQLHQLHQRTAREMRSQLLEEQPVHVVPALLQVLQARNAFAWSLPYGRGGKPPIGHRAMAKEPKELAGELSPAILTAEEAKGGDRAHPR